MYNIVLFIHIIIIITVTNLWTSYVDHNVTFSINFI